MPVSRIGSTVLGIAGAGIGIGLLAHTARNVSRMTDDLYRPRSRHHQRPPRKRDYQPRRKSPMYRNQWGIKRYW